MLITGASGFLGSCLVAHLNAHNFNYLIASDHFNEVEKNKNLNRKKLQQRIDYAQTLDWLDQHYEEVEFILHFADTAPYDSLVFFQEVWRRSVHYQIPLLFEAKPTTEEWISAQAMHPFYWAGLRLPQVYGPNEYHLGKSASWVFRAYQELIEETTPFFQQDASSCCLVYIKDVVAVGYFLIRHRTHPGIYSLEHDQTYLYENVREQVASILQQPAEYTNTISPTLPVIDPGLLATGYTQPFYCLAEGIEDCVQHYLRPHRYW